MLDCTPALTPADPNVQFSKNVSAPLDGKYPYRTLTGRLLYLACTARLLQWVYYTDTTAILDSNIGQVQKEYYAI